MNKRTKLLESMQNNPQSQFGIECRNSGGSHHIVSHPGVEVDVSVPAHRLIKPVYIRQFLKLVQRVKELKS